MNVMAKAHKITRDTVDASPVKLCYRSLFVAALKDCHKMNKEQMAAVKHFEDAIARTLVHFEKLGVNDYYIAIENNSQINDYTILKHKNENDLQSPLGWASYANAIVTHPRQADQYVIAYPGVVKLHAQTYLSKVLESFRENIAQIQK
ncbi:hypothetical protein QGX17_gp053 [Pseudomonas phage phiPsa381]|uniref:Uncharacterized protein n=1 Tax=Pseudomonas phage phiPsa381 TaxID=1460366 RepID=A0A7G9V2V5_9CAUD|nr:hypothetical protein QGX17_gp053 [Pseudomonas phage phiPsa381]QNO00611.1 hypothetical protein phiPsa381_171 [Pseudomonas phage phiPsa381]